jgi:hypothetical protein
MKAPRGPIRPIFGCCRFSVIRSPLRFSTRHSVSEEAGFLRTENGSRIPPTSPAPIRFISSRFRPTEANGKSRPPADLNPVGAPTAENFSTLILQPKESSWPFRSNGPRFQNRPRLRNSLPSPVAGYGVDDANQYVAAPDGQRFMFIRDVLVPDGADRITVLINWLAGLKGLK